MTADLAHDLGSALDGEVRFDDYSRHLFSRDASMYSIMPAGVVFPRHADDVAAAVSIAGEHDVQVLARGAGTSLAGQTVGPGLVVDFSRHMRDIVSIDAEVRTARVQPGVVQDQLNRAAASYGLMFGPDKSTSDRATIGGMIGNNSAGSSSVRYGMTIDHVRELDVVLADGSRTRFSSGARARTLAPREKLDGLGQRIRTGLPELVAEHRRAIAEDSPAYWRRAGGYRLDRLLDGIDLAKFVVGSEGTLAVTTEAVVDLVPKPRHTVIAVGHFTSTDAAIEATEDALSCSPAAVELLDRTILDLSRTKIEYARLGSILSGDPEALLFVTFAGDSPVADLDRLDAVWRRNGHGYHTLRAETAAQQSALLKVRKAGLGLLMAASTGTRRPLAFIEDTAVDPARLAAYTKRVREVLDRHGLRAGFYGHSSVGCLHIRPFVDVSQPDQVRTMRAVAEEVKDLVREFGGVNSSEHGDGLVRSEFNEELFGPELYAAMQKVKRLFDPGNRLNPGKIVDAPPMTSHLRDAALPPAAALRTRLAFAGGMRSAADRCMNIGLCRKSDSGVMCPSYMATLEEEHATRGRANALVKALSAPDPAAALGDDRLHEILDLCLMCKACKSECPLSVDMASLKAETLAQRYDAHGVPLRSRLFAGIRTLNRLGSATAPVSNVLAVRPVRRLLGIAPQRPLPRFRRRNLIRWFRPDNDPGLPEVFFLADSFTSYTEPEIGRAAVELLRSAGFAVRLASGGCCGRASFSKGLLDDAKRKAASLAASLAGSDAPIVGCEPSCVWTLRDEHVQLLPDDPHVREVASRVQQVEELLLSALSDGRLSLHDSWLSGQRILYHGHCHQKAEVGTAATVELLRRIPGVEVAEVDAGCCGMAGSFGFESEHYALSMSIGGSRLFPAVRAEPDSVLAATGVSCRQQIRHGTGRTAYHPLELVRFASG